VTNASSSVRITPEPTIEEAAAIAAAIEITRPRIMVGQEVEPEERWRFSGRWWSRPVASRRARPAARS